MTCNRPPFANAVLGEADHICPNRLRTHDGVCAGPTHAKTGDHWPSGVNNYAHAVDISEGGGFDPRDFLGAIIARRDARVKYMVYNLSGYQGRSTNLPDMIVGPNTNWIPAQNGSFKQDHYDVPHLHVSFWPSAEQSVSPFFGGTQPFPSPGHPEGDHMAIVQPVGVPAGKKPRLVGRTMGATLNAAEHCVDLHNGAAIRGDSGTSDSNLRKWHLNQPGNPIGIAQADARRPGGAGIVVFFDNHITIDGYWS